ncbi:MAG: S-layer homology domain-containing protein [Clostridia bacterium]|nr:S-layer homology domain-containing protein [Clostridia bacterium]
MKLIKRTLSLLLVVTMLLGTALSASAANVTFTDVAGHWAWTNGQIPYLVSKGVLNGYAQSNGTYIFKPDGAVTRAEFIKMLDETFGLTALRAIAYTDVNAGDWFYPYFQKAAAQGYILYYGSSANPNGQITREEAISLLVRYLDLPADEKAPASTFLDYNSISDQFKDYVLMAIYASLINGYEVKGGYEFRPKNTLTRAEALTILYRAAGSIFNYSATKRDAGAPSTNNVFTKSDIIIDGVTLGGRNIVSEGASSGLIDFKNCKIDGTLYIRGGADVTLENCQAGQIVVSGGGTLSLANNTRVSDVIVDASSHVYVYTGTSIDYLTVNTPNLQINGNGSIGNLTVRAAGLTSAIFPSSYDIAQGLTASLANAPYSGKSSDIASFSVNPFVTADANNYYVNVKTSMTGRVYAYFTNNDVTPAINEFDSYYELSNYSTYFNAEEGRWTTAVAGTASSVGNYQYLVLQLQKEGRKFRPVVIPLTINTTNGFSTAPYLSDSTTLTFKGNSTGTVYWLYTDDGNALTAAAFLNLYDAKETALKGSVSMDSISNSRIELNANYLKNYRYVALMVRTNAGAYCYPVVIPVGDTGFSVAPSVKTAGVISFKTNVSGDLYYYLTSEKVLPNADKFRSEYNAATYKSNMTVRLGLSDEFKFDTSRTGSYPYMVIAIRNSSGVYLQPVILEVNVSTGFDVDPSVKSSEEIRFRTSDSGVVRYYYTNSSSAPSIEEFKRQYENVDSKYYGYVRVNGISYEYINYKAQYANTKPYMAIMFTDSNDKEYAPVLVELDHSTDSGFTVTPYVSGDKIYFQTGKDGEVWYFYTTNDDAIPAEDFYDEYRDTTSSYRGTVDSVKSGKLTSFEIDTNAYRRNSYIVLAFLADDARGYDFSYPYVLDIEDSRRDSAGSGLKTYPDTSDDTVTVRTEYDGYLYYYLTNSENDFPSESNFEKKYNAASRYDSFKVSANDYKTINARGYDYVVLCLEYKYEYLTPVVIDMTKGSTYTNGLDDGSNASGTGFSDVSLGRDLKTVSFTPKASGTVSLYIVRDKTMDKIDSVECNADTVGTITLPDSDLISILYGGATYYIQLKSGKNVYEAYRVVTLNN